VDGGYLDNKLANDQGAGAEARASKNLMGIIKLPVVVVLKDDMSMQ
jgi:hypothetical protein